MFGFLGTCIYIGLHPIWAWYLGGTQRARVAIISDDKVLLVRHWLDLNRWDIPGGGQSGKESLKESAVREIHEEVHIQIDTDKLTLIRPIDIRFGLIRFKAHYFMADIKKPKVVKSNWPEILEHRWFSHKELENIRIHGDVRTILDDCMINR